MHRSRAREIVLFALYQTEFLPVSLDELLEDEAPEDQREYIESVYHGVGERREELDRIIGARTVGWRFERLALLDRNILRIGVYEMLFREDVPAEVAMDEAVELAKKYGTDPAPAFINGILDRIWRDERERATA
jgi:transcription antitermination protein NusB